MGSNVLKGHTYNYGILCTNYKLLLKGRIMKNVLLDEKTYEGIPKCSAERQPVHVYVAGMLFFDVISTEISIVVQADYSRFSTPYPSLGARGHNKRKVCTSHVTFPVVKRACRAQLHVTPSRTHFVKKRRPPIDHMTYRLRPRRS